MSITRRLLDQYVKLSYIKRCWKDQLRLKREQSYELFRIIFTIQRFFSDDDFVSDCDLYIACLILQKQVEHINGIKENIIIPSIRMKDIHERNSRYFIKNNELPIFILFFVRNNST